MARHNGEPFVPLKPFEWQLSPYTLKIDKIVYDDLISWMRSDGRPMGILADRLICARFHNLAIPQNGCGSFDIIEYPVAGGARSYEVKTASKGNAADLVPSLMKGKGRSFDAARHEARREGLYGYIVLDVGRLPLIRMIGLPMEYIVRLGYLKRIPRKSLDRLFTPDMLSELA